MTMIPDGWTEVTNGDWGHGPVRFQDNVPVGSHYQNSVGARAVLTPDDVFMVEGISLDPPNRGKPDGAWWPYVAGETDTPTNFEPWIDSSPAIVAPAVPAATPSVPPVPSQVKVEAVGGSRGWLVHVEHAGVVLFHEIVTDPATAVRHLTEWLRTH